MEPYKRYLNVFIAVAAAVATGCIWHGSAHAESRRGGSLILDVCGTAHQYDKVPERVVAYSPSIVEMLFFLGLSDRIVGYGGISSENNIDERMRPVLDNKKNLSVNGLSIEPLLGLAADFVIGGWIYGFRHGGVTPSVLDNYGIASYAVTESCIRVEERERVRLEDTIDDLKNIAEIFDVAPEVWDRIRALEAQIIELASATSQVERRPRVFVYDSGEKAPVTTGRFAIPHAMIEIARGVNIFSELSSSWITANWEDVIVGNPEWIVVIDYGPKTAEEKIEFLRKKKELADIDAIQKNQFITVPFAGALPGPFNIRFAQQLASKIHPEIDVVIKDPLELMPLGASAQWVIE